MIGTNFESELALDARKQGLNDFVLQFKHLVAALALPVMMWRAAR